MKHYCVRDNKRYRPEQVSHEHCKGCHFLNNESACHVTAFPTGRKMTRT